jgi:hypothetical protein
VIPAFNQDGRQVKNRNMGDEIKKKNVRLVAISKVVSEDKIFM